MRTTPTTSAPLLPALPNALARFKSTPLLSVATGFEPADLLHLWAAVGGHRQGDVLEVLGFCLCLDEQGEPYGLRAYVRPSATEHVAFTERTAVRFPEAGQQERWLGNERPLLLTEIDITDHADSLALERPAPVPAVTVVVRSLPQPAPGLRKAA